MHIHRKGLYRKGVYITPLLTKNCIFCNKKFFNRDKGGKVHPIQFSKRKYCSNSCFGLSRKKKPSLFKRCLFCNKEFSNERKNGKLYSQKRFSEKKCCSLLCGVQIRKPFNEYKIKDNVLFIYFRDKIIITDADKKESILKLKWYVDNNGYPCTCLPKTPDRIKRHIRMHTLFMGKKEGLVVDHINRDPLDNRISNLRFATHKENLYNSQIGDYWLYLKRKDSSFQLKTPTKEHYV